MRTERPGPDRQLLPHPRSGIQEAMTSASETSTMDVVLGNRTSSKWLVPTVRQVYFIMATKQNTSSEHFLQLSEHDAAEWNQIESYQNVCTTVS